ncbi:hypothetical protein R1T16_10465 [Flavobacterium sp. DG1-102-2]|uniref:hypothetical protein n=1 Tax=Flavobacterium sp. DG1-102-2 TaxID=3081663 RepID=UPI00294A9476|nr:hypothetical protein [Flavobacterium sp. DG1-102-2]MDV6168849.1 hypothetical protein [Flavobacterium sp. DG1-102-2]
MLYLAITACNSKSIPEKETASISTAPKISGKEFVAHLEKLGYFKYASPKDFDSLKVNMANLYDPSNELVTIWDDETGTPRDYRLYACDSEALFEAGGFKEMLAALKPTFDKIGLKTEVSSHVEEWDTKNNWLNHFISINGTRYTIFKNFTGSGWGEAVQTFADILNNELQLQNKEDRIYLINGGNDGRIIFLSPAQFNYIDSIYNNKQWKPLEVKDWCLEMNVKPQKI